MRLVAEPDRDRIGNDGRDLAFVSVRALDAAGNPVPVANDLLRFRIAGPADIVATDNGDATDMTAFPSHERRLFSGRALAIVRARPGERGNRRAVGRGGRTTRCPRSDTRARRNPGWARQALRHRIGPAAADGLAAHRAGGATCPPQTAGSARQ